MSQAELRFRSIEDYLGPAENRFFGRGYAKAGHHITGIAVDPLEVGQGSRAKVTVTYPADWSKKKGTIDLPPHLSTVDMLLLGAQLSEFHLTHARGLDEEARARSWLRRVILRAGNEPQEHLSDLDGTASLVRTAPVPGSPELWESVYDTAVGAMSARCVIRHPAGTPAEAAGVYGAPEDVLGDGTHRYFGEGFRYRQQHVEDVRIDMAGLRGSAAVRIEPVGAAATAARGLEGFWQPSVTMLDCFVVDLQLAQVLMYELDSVRRQDSHTLWMIKTVLEAPDPNRPYPESLGTSVSITGKHLLPLRGATWRNVELAGECAGISLKCSFAHQLPASAAS